MASPAERPLRLVPTGEVPDDAPQTLAEALDVIAEMRDQLDGAEKDVRAWRTRYAILKRDKDREAKNSEWWPIAKRVFDYWRDRCRHPRCAFTIERFRLIEPFLTDSQYGETLPEREALCRRAIDGAAYDPFITKRKNGTSKRHDGIELIFRSPEKFEEFCNRAPRNDATP